MAENRGPKQLFKISSQIAPLGFYPSIWGAFSQFKGKFGDLVTKYKKIPCIVKQIQYNEFASFFFFLVAFGNHIEIHSKHACFFKRMKPLPVRQNTCITLLLEIRWFVCYNNHALNNF